MKYDRETTRKLSGTQSEPWSKVTLGEGDCTLRPFQQQYYHYRVDGQATTHLYNYSEKNTALDLDLQWTLQSGWESPQITHSSTHQTQDLHGANSAKQRWSQVTGVQVASLHCQISSKSKVTVVRIWLVFVQRSSRSLVRSWKKLIVDLGFYIKWMLLFER